MFKLNLGAGLNPLPGYTNLDIQTTGDLVFPLDKYPDNSADEIRASHVLEHFGARDVPQVLQEWVRVLKPGGRLCVAVPNFEWICEQFRTGNPGNYPLHAYVMGGQVDEYDFHKTIFTEQSLGEMMRGAGCTNVSKWTDGTEVDTASLPVSLNLQAFKGQPQERPIVVAGAMSLPRYGPIIAQYAVQQMSVALNIPVYHGYGVNWHHSLTRSIEQALSLNKPVKDEWLPADFVLTIDYDTVFTPHHVGHLAALLHDNPEIDVVVPMQMKREGGPLLAATDGGVDLTADLVPIVTGHFGLTMFRRRVFEWLPKPWFGEEPAPDGGWGEGRVDSDIGFWRNCQKTGLRVCLATQCRVGHLEDVITWPVLGPQGVVPIYQKSNEWLATRQPPQGV